MNISKLIKKAMIDKEVNNKFLSSKTGFDESKVSRIVNGKNSSLVDIDVVLGALGFKLTVVNK